MLAAVIAAVLVFAPLAAIPRNQTLALETGRLPFGHVIVVTKDVQPGESMDALIEDGFLMEIEVPMGTIAEGSATHVSQIEGRTSRRPIRKNEQIDTQYLSNKQEPTFFAERDTFIFLEGARPIILSYRHHDVPSAPLPMPQPPHVVYQQVVQPAPANGMAVAGFVCGLVAAVLFWTAWGGVILGILGVIFGAIGWSKANQGAPNKGLAMAGLILGAIAVVGSIPFTIAIVEAVNNADAKFAEVECAVTGNCWPRATARPRPLTSDPVSPAAAHHEQARA